MAHDVYPSFVWIAARLFIRLSNKYLVLLPPAIYPATDLDCLSRYVRTPYRLCVGTTMLVVSAQRHALGAAGQLTISALAAIISSHG